LLILTWVAWGLDTEDITVEWTSEGKKLARQIPAPRGRLYASQIVDNPHVRHGITDEAQSQIIPTLTRYQQ